RGRSPSLQRGEHVTEAAFRNFTLNVGPQKPNISLRETVQQGGRPPRVRRSIAREGALCGTARSHGGSGSRTRIPSEGRAATAARLSERRGTIAGPIRASMRAAPGYRDEAAVRRSCPLGPAPSRGRDT